MESAHASQASSLGAAGVLPCHASAFVSDYGETGRCHNREYRFRFGKCRRMYRQCLFEATKRFQIVGTHGTTEATGTGFRSLF